MGHYGAVDTATEQALRALEDVFGEETSLAVVTVVEPPVVVQPAKLSFTQKLQQLEDEVFERNLEITHDATHFREIEPGTKIPPEAWVAELGMERAKARLRAANAAWLGAKDAPVGLSMAKAIVGSVAKARAVREGGATTLNIEMVIMPAPRQREYEVIEVRGE